MLEFLTCRMSHHKTSYSPQSQLRTSPSLPGRLLVSTIHETKKMGC
jgi:hypothetical protein